MVLQLWVTCRLLPGDIWRHLETSLVVTPGLGEIGYRLEARGAARNPAVPPTARNYLAPNASGAEVESPVLERV